MPDPRSLFVVHGRDIQVVDAFWPFFQALGLRPLDWEECVAKTGSATPFLGDVLHYALDDSQAAIVLVTPDDVAYLHPDLQRAEEAEYERRPTCQARPNVLFEAGMAFALLRERTVLVEIGQVRPFSDIAGRNKIEFDGSAAKLQKIRERLKNAGCAVKDGSGTDWLDTSRFDGLAAFTRCL